MLDEIVPLAGDWAAPSLSLVPLNEADLELARGNLLVARREGIEPPTF